MLSLDWYFSSPLDFEHKNYLLLQYLKIVDDSYSVKVLSPYLLYTEKLVLELNNFMSNIENLNKHLKSDIESIDLVNKRILRKQIKKTDEINVVLEIVDYSLPLLESKIKLGYKLLDKYPQLLF